MAKRMEFVNITEAFQCLSSHELDTNFRYSTYKSSKNFGDGNVRSAKKVFWKDQGNVTTGRQEFTGIPFVVLGQKVLDCQFGKDRHCREKERRKKLKIEDDHSTYRKGRKFIVQDTKKLECPARCVIRELCRFLSYKVTPEPIDPRLAKKIKELSQGGQTDIQTIKSVLNSYVREICNPLPNPKSYRFYPSDKVISNHIYAANHCHKKGDEQESIIGLVNEWQNKGDFVFAQLKCRDATTSTETVQYGDKFLLAYQSQEQRRLLMRYGKMCFLDATYKTTLYVLPLFFVAVRTNVGYQVVATFICENETSEAIAEGLKVIKDNCPTWQPKYFLCDFQESEILAIERIFPDATVLLCDVHRNRAWDRWTKTKENVHDHGKEIMSWFMRLGQASNEKKFYCTLEEFRASIFWTDRVRNYMEKYGCHKKRWSEAFRTGLVDIVAATNNGIEAQHKVFKSKFLNRKTTCSLTTMLKILTNDFFPSRMKIYNDLNLTYSGRYKKYSKDIPVAIQNRPREFIKHCMQGIELSNSITRSNVTENDGIFNVLTDGRTYKVTLGNKHEMPSCECETWYKFQMPCEHLVAAMKIGAEIEWSLLSPLYLESVYCTVDDPHAEERDDSENQVEDLTMDDSPVQSPEIPALEPFEDEVQEVDSNMSVKTAQAKTREKIKILNNLTYNIFNINILREIETQVMAIVSKHEVKAEPPMLPLPKRSAISKQRKRLSLSKKRKKKASTGEWRALQPNGEENVETVHEIWSDLLGEDVILTEDNFDILHTDNSLSEATNVETLQEIDIDHQDSVIAGKLVNKLWSLNADLNIPVAKPYGMVVTDTDIRSLKPCGWLTDNILDCYLNMLSTELREQVPKQNVLHLVTSLMSSIASGIYKMSNTRGFRHKLSDYETVTGIYGRASHWTLVIVDIATCTIYFYNPTGESKKEMEHILANWKTFIEQYNKVGNDHLPTEWTIRTKQHTLQWDGYSCGVFCLLIAEKHLKNERGLDLITDDTLVQFRRSIAEKVVMFEDCITDSCPKCGFRIEDDNMLQCSQCQRMFHFKPYCIGDSLEDMQDEEVQFICKLCKIEFWAQILPCVPTEDFLQRTVHWTNKAEVMKKLEESKDIDQDVMIIDKTVPTSPLFGHRKLRPGPKQKRRSSFFYPKLKKIKAASEKVYCVCRQPYKKSEPMWCCDVCEEWLHPHCIGRDDDEKGPGKDTAFLCEPCLSHELKERPIETLKDILQASVEDDSDEKEDEYYITTEDAHKNLLEAYKRCWYLVRVEGMSSVLPWMKRHFDFIRQNGSAKSYGFGEALFSQQAIFTIKLNLRNRFQRKKEPKSIYSMHNTIPAMANRTAKKFLDKEIGQSENYIDQVLLRESMIIIMQKVTGKAYANAESELQKTEGKKLLTANKLILNYMIKDRLNFIQSNRKMLYQD